MVTENKCAICKSRPMAGAGAVMPHACIECNREAAASARHAPEPWGTPGDYALPMFVSTLIREIETAGPAKRRAILVALGLAP